MQYPIKIHNVVIGTDQQAVSAKELHAVLDCSTRYADWITRRIKKYGFEENRDYIVVRTKKPGNNAILKEYYITLDMAKELAMVENNEKGRQIRLYFIEVEKRMRQTTPAGCPASDNMSTRISGYKGMLKRKQNEIDHLRRELAAAKTKLQELENRKIAGGDWIFAEHNLLDLAGALARHKEELDTYGRQLQAIAQIHQRRTDFIDRLLTNLMKHHPKTANVAQNAKTHAKQYLQEAEYSLKQLKNRAITP